MITFASTSLIIWMQSSSNSILLHICFIEIIEILEIIQKWKRWKIELWCQPEEKSDVIGGQLQLLDRLGDGISFASCVLNDPFDVVPGDLIGQCWTDDLDGLLHHLLVHFNQPRSSFVFHLNALQICKSFLVVQPNIRQFLHGLSFLTLAKKKRKKRNAFNRVAWFYLSVLAKRKCWNSGGKKIVSLHGWNISKSNSSRIFCIVFEWMIFFFCNIQR